MGSLGQSLEDYLEAIYLLSKDKRVVRVTDVAKRLNVKKPSVVIALKRLKREGLIVQERYGYIELTDEGKRVAEEVYFRHTTLFRFFRDVLGLSEELAEKDACMMEHYLSREALDRIRSLMELVQKRCPEVVEALSER